MRRFNIGDKVIIDDEPGIIESVILTADGARYDVRYGIRSIMIATDVPESELEPDGYPPHWDYM